MSGKAKEKNFVNTDFLYHIRLTHFTNSFAYYTADTGLSYLITLLCSHTCCYSCKSC